MATTANDAAPAAGKKTTATAAYKRWKTKLGKLAEGTPDYDAHMLVGHGKGFITTTKLNKAIIRGFAHRAEKMPGRTGSTQPTA